MDEHGFGWDDRTGGENAAGAVRRGQKTLWPPGGQRPAGVSGIGAGKVTWEKSDMSRLPGRIIEKNE